MCYCDYWFEAFQPKWMDASVRQEDSDVLTHYIWPNQYLAPIHWYLCIRIYIFKDEPGWIVSKIKHETHDDWWVESVS